MSYLFNRISQKELKQQLQNETFKRITISFYKYFHVKDPQQFRDAMYLQLNNLKVFGRIYIAHEGINAQVSVPEFNYEAFEKYVKGAVGNGQWAEGSWQEKGERRQETGDTRQWAVSSGQLTGDSNESKNNYSLYTIQHSSLPAPRSSLLRLNIAVDDDGKSFWVLKIKVRDKIVADGIRDKSFSMEKKGKYVNAKQFNDLSADPQTIIVDMRNHYEYEVGHFEKAVEIPSDTFREQLPMAVDMLRDKKDNNIIMYCTGGIRCEKASAYMLHNGFKNVFHLEGGIIHYANTVKEKQLENKFLGRNFVFDDRLGEKVGEEIISICHQCGTPADTHTNCVNPGCHLLFIQCAACSEKYENCCSVECQNIIHLPEEEQMKIRKGIVKGRNVFNKSKKRMLSLKQE